MHHDDAGPLIAVAIFETEAAIIQHGRPPVELEMRHGELPAADLVAHLRALAPQVVAVIPGDPAPGDSWRYAIAYGTALGVCAGLGIAVEVPPPLRGNRTHH